MVALVLRDISAVVILSSLCRTICCLSTKLVLFASCLEKSDRV
jgi:hypothetical protein